LCLAHDLHDQVEGFLGTEQLRRKLKRTVCTLLFERLVGDAGAAALALLELQVFEHGLQVDFVVQVDVVQVAVALTQLRLQGADLLFSRHLHVVQFLVEPLDFAEVIQDGFDSIDDLD